MICLTGLPNSGATLLCQLLGQHPEIDSLSHTSPLCSTLITLRQRLSSDPSLLAQLNQEFDTTYSRLTQAFQGFINGWFATADTPWIVDHHLDWLRHLETLHLLAPKCKVVVCVRELGQILGAIETQHHQTQLLDFPDSLATLTKSQRATQFFADDGVVGSALCSLEAVQDYPESLQQSLYYVVFEHLMTDPATVMQGIFDWLQLSPHSINPTNLQAVRQGNLSQRNDDLDLLKYSEPVASQITSPARFEIPDRFEVILRDRFSWFYNLFYPGLPLGL